MVMVPSAPEQRRCQWLLVLTSSRESSGWMRLRRSCLSQEIAWALEVAEGEDVVMLALPSAEQAR